MNDDACNDATNLPVSLNNESTPGYAIFSDAAPAPTSGAGFFFGGGGSLLQSGVHDEYLEEEEDFNIERDDYAYLYEG